MNINGVHTHRLAICFWLGSSYARSSVVTAVKFTISDHPQPIDPLLKNCIGEWRQLMLVSYFGSTEFSQATVLQ